LLPTNVSITPDGQRDATRKNRGVGGGGLDFGQAIARQLIFAQFCMARFN
jgi:hypothetical protein